MVTLPGPFPKIKSLMDLLRAELNTKLENIGQEDLYADVELRPVSASAYHYAPIPPESIEEFPAIVIMPRFGNREDADEPPNYGEIEPIVFTVDLFVYVLNEDDPEKLIISLFGYVRAIDEVIAENPKLDGTEAYTIAGWVARQDFSDIFVDDSNTYFGVGYLEIKILATG